MATRAEQAKAETQRLAQLSSRAAIKKRAKQQLAADRTAKLLTRRSTARPKPDTQLELRQKRRVQAPETRARKAIATTKVPGSLGRSIR